MEEVPEVAKEWEACAAIRRRFQNNKSLFLQFPVNVVDVGPPEADAPLGDDGEKIPTHPICTKSLEMNIDAVQIMVEVYHGEFVDIPYLQKEVGIQKNNMLLSPCLFQWFHVCWNHPAHWFPLEWIIDL